MSEGHRLAGIAVALAAGIALAQGASAGPPLICHPFVINGEAQLPWGDAPGWSSPAPDYPTEQVATDTLRLLSDDAPVLARMENLRRATIYVSTDARAAADLLDAIIARTKAPARSGRSAALAWFDAGYLIESYRQYGLVRDYRMVPAGGPATEMLPPELEALDGHALVQKAIALSSDGPTSGERLATEQAAADAAAMELAASLMVRDPNRARAHRRRAAALAADAGSDALLVANLARLSSLGVGR